MILTVTWGYGGFCDGAPPSATWRRHLSTAPAEFARNNTRHVARAPKQDSHPPPPTAPPPTHSISTFSQVLAVLALVLFDLMLMCWVLRELFRAGRRRGGGADQQGSSATVSCPALHPVLVIEPDHKVDYAVKVEGREDRERVDLATGIPLVDLSVHVSPGGSREGSGHPVMASLRIPVPSPAVVNTHTPAQGLPIDGHDTSTTTPPDHVVIIPLDHEPPVALPRAEDTARSAGSSRSNPDAIQDPHPDNASSACCGQPNPNVIRDRHRGIARSPHHSQRDVSAGDKDEFPLELCSVSMAF